MKIWTLVENTSAEECLQAEHGLSLYIETEAGCRILFDAGQSAAFADNAQRLGVDLHQADLAILSHGHYDHSGGLGRFLEINDRAPVYVSTRAFGAHYNASEQYIGVDPALADSTRLIPVGDWLDLGEGMYLCSCNSCVGAYPAEAYGLTIREDGIGRPDDFLHEQYLVIEEKGKRFVFSGCSHKGIQNIVRWLEPDVLIGGFHFMKLDPVRDAAVLASAAAELLSHKAVYYTGHCTGEAQYADLKARMGSRLYGLSTGTVLTL